MNDEVESTIDRVALLCTGRRWDRTPEHLAEVLDRQQVAIEVLDAHNDWLSSCRTRVLASGLEWNTATCRERSRRDGDLTTAPEWIAEAIEQATPPENERSEGVEEISVTTDEIGEQFAAATDGVRRRARSGDSWPTHKGRDRLRRRRSAAHLKRLAARRVDAAARWREREDRRLYG